MDMALNSLVQCCAVSRLVINCVGPFRLFGEPVFEACCVHGTDYLDVTGMSQGIQHAVCDKHTLQNECLLWWNITNPSPESWCLPDMMHKELRVSMQQFCQQLSTCLTQREIAGEPEFIERMESKYQRQAQETGSLMASAAGFDSAVADLGVLHAMRQLSPPSVPTSVESFLAIHPGPKGARGQRNPGPMLIIQIHADCITLRVASQSACVHGAASELVQSCLAAHACKPVATYARIPAANIH